jgi:pimeloyl-ACP methyl ester carboxylesterase
MTKTGKFLLGAGVFFSAALAVELINNRIFDEATKKSRMYSQFYDYYEWKFGKTEFKIHYRYVAGMDNAMPPVLLVHGTDEGASHADFERQIAELSAVRDVYTIDLLGYGFSDKPAVSYSAYLYATLINAFVRDVINEQTDVMAYGMGGNLALCARAFEPAMYGKLTLYSPIVSDTENNPFLAHVLALPIVGTLIYNIKNSLSALGQKRYLAAHFMPTKHRTHLGIKFAYMACLHGALDVDISRFIDENVEVL